MTSGQDLAAQVERLTQQVAELQRQLGAGGSLPGARFTPELNVVYRAPVTGYLSVYFSGGRTGYIEVRVGQEQPTESVGEANSGSDKSYLGAVIRAGELFVVDANGKSPAWRCVFTPLF